MSDLFVLLDGRNVGVVSCQRGRLSFTYAEAWRSAAGAYPLSLSMPLAAAEHPHGAIEPFLWGLLPDNEVVLTRWAQRFHVSPRNVFALISEVGYPDSDSRKAKMAMKIGDEYGLEAIGIRQWRKFAASSGIDGDALIQRIRAMASELPDRLADEIRSLRDAALSHPVIDTLGAVLTRCAARIAKA